MVEDVNLRLQERGHETYVLTSVHGVNDSTPEVPGVERSLTLESDLYHYRPVDFLLSYKNRLERNLERTRIAIQGFQPDVVLVNGMENLSRAIPWLVEQLLPGKVAYYVANDWPHTPNPHEKYWLDEAHQPGRKWIKRMLAPLALNSLPDDKKIYPLRFDYVMCVSQWVRKELAQKAGIPWENMEVVHNGVEFDLFWPRTEPPRTENDRLELVYAGSMVTHKGVHTAVEALALLARDDEPMNVHLTLAGSGHPDYEAGLRRLVEKNGLSEWVSFRPRVARNQMPDLLRQYEVLIFPSIWEEPLARMVQEAMACGLVVVGTPTGGTPEILVEGETGLMFPAGDAAALAGQIRRLYADPHLRARLASRGREVVLERFNLERTVNEIEAGLRRFIGQEAGAAAELASTGREN